MPGNVTTHIALPVLSLLQDRAMDQAISRRPLSAETRGAPRSVCIEFMAEKVTLGQVFLQILRFSLINIIPSFLRGPPHS
jgi:hypothetical protein